MNWWLPAIPPSVDGDRMPPLPARDRDWLTPVLDQRAVSGLLLHLTSGRSAGACRRVHARYRPGADCSALYAVGTDSTRPTYIHLYTNAPVRALPGLDNDTAARPGMLLRGAVAVPGIRAVVREFPDDPLLPGLAMLHAPMTLAAELRDALGLPPTASGSAFRLLRYKPGLRAVLRREPATPSTAGGGDDAWSCVVRFEDPRVSIREAATVAAVTAAMPGDGWLLPPPPVRRAADGLWSCRAWVQGADLGRSLRGPDGGSAATTCGRALAGLQALPVTGLAWRGGDDTLRDLERQVEALLAAEPGAETAAEFASTMRELAAMAAATGAGPLTLVHGDFHQGQLVPCGDRLAVLDWDRAHLGEAAADHGNFAAQAWLLEQRGKADARVLCEAFNAAFATAGGRLPDAGRIRLWTCLAIAGLAVREARRLRPDWQARAVILLRECRRQAQEVRS